MHRSSIKTTIIVVVSLGIVALSGINIARQIFQARDQTEATT